VVLTAEWKERKGKAKEDKLMRAKDMKKWININKRKYIDLFQLQDWQINIYIINKDNPLSKKNEDGELTGKGFCAAGECRTSYEYHSARIRLFAKQISNVGYLKRVFVHELAHVATSSFDLYTKYFSEKVLFSTYHDVAQSIRSNVCELLAMQIELIVCGKDKNHVVIRSDHEKIKDGVESLCSSLNIIRKKRIITNESTPQKSPREIVEEEMKNNPDYWYKQWRKAEDVKDEEERKEQTFKELIAPSEPLTNDEAELLKYKCERAIKDGNSKIIIPLNIKGR
jgi:hypothetical protein